MTLGQRRSRALRRQHVNPWEADPLSSGAGENPSSGLRLPGEGEDAGEATDAEYDEEQVAEIAEDAVARLSRRDGVLDPALNSGVRSAP
jgi:hypothetical protein